MLYFFTGVFILEAVVKIIAFGRRYFKEVWNVLDLLVILGTIIGQFLEIFIQIASFNTSVLRIFRISKVLKLLKT
jgi:hypothetical protein